MTGGYATCKCIDINVLIHTFSVYKIPGCLIIIQKPGLALKTIGKNKPQMY